MKDKQVTKCKNISYTTIHKVLLLYTDDYIKSIACKICLNSQTYASALFNVNIGSGNTTCLGINDSNNKNNYNIPSYLIMKNFE